MHMPAQELAHVQTMLIAVRCHGIGQRGEAVSNGPGDGQQGEKRDLDDPDRLQGWHRPGQGRCTSIKYQLKSQYFLFAMLQPAPAAFLRDPVTVPRAERIEHYRAQPDRYRQLAECDGPASVREGLVELARQCDAMAEALRQRGQRQ